MCAHQHQHFNPIPYVDKYMIIDKIKHELWSTLIYLNLCNDQTCLLQNSLLQISNQVSSNNKQSECYSIICKINSEYYQVITTLSEGTEKTTF